MHMLTYLIKFYSLIAWKEKEVLPRIPKNIKEIFR